MQVFLRKINVQTIKSFLNAYLSTFFVACTALKIYLLHRRMDAYRVKWKTKKANNLLFAHTIIY
jgi:ABC-type glycerol-3-phosphate transport system permease component